MVVGFSSCASRTSADSAARGEGGGPTSGATDVLAAIARLDPFLLASEQQLTSICMDRLGIRYDVVTPTETAERPSALARDVEQIRREGYRLSSEPGTEIPINDPNRAHIAALSPARQAEYTRALFGDDATSVSATMPNGMVVSTNVGGCLSETRRDLYGDLETWLRLDFIRNNLMVEVQQRMTSDVEYEDAIERWRSCMKQRGYDFDRLGDAPDQAARAYATNASGEAARATEMAIATSDATCDDEARLSATTARVAARHEADVAARHEGDLVAFRELTERAAETAKQRLGVSGG